MELPTLSTSEREALINHLAKALDDMIATSCIEMAPLWVHATRLQREELDVEHHALGFTPSQRFLALSKGARSRYRYLATWRHAVLSEGIERLVEDEDHRALIELVYFTPYPPNAPPYAWSRKVTAAPGAVAFAGTTPSDLKNGAKEGCFASVAALRARVRALDADGSLLCEIKAKLLRTGCRDTVREVLKLERNPKSGSGFPEWEPI